MKKEANLLKIKKSSIPYIDSVVVKPGVSEVTNLETTYREFTNYQGQAKKLDPDIYDNFGYDHEGPALNEDEYFALPEDCENSVFVNETDTQHLYNGINFVANDELRPVMNGVFFGNYICASDAYSLYWKKTNVNKDFGETKHGIPKGIILHIDFVKLLKMKKVTSFELFYSEKYCKVKTEEFEIVSRVIEGNYPNFLSVIPQDNDNFIIFDVKEMTTALKKIQPAANKDNHLFKFTLNPANVSTQDIDRDIAANVSIEDKGKDIGNVEQIGLDLKKMFTCLQLIKGDAKMKFSAPHRAVIFNEDTLLMPMVINS